MSDQIIAILVKLAGAYLVIGLAVAFLFFTRWIKVADPAAAEGTWGFRVLVTPGMVALWPVVVMKICSRMPGSNAKGAEALRRNHRLAIIGLTIALALVFAAALVWRTPPIADLPAPEVAFP